MGVVKKKPYEISIWEDRLVTIEPDSSVSAAGAQNGQETQPISYFKEIKLAVIGSDKMESPNRAFDPVLIENVNGEKTLTFSIAYKYYDEYTGEIIKNPFSDYLINERKVKLFYNDEWFEFLIKECEETSSEYVFKYTAKELFSLELAKLGYNVTLDTSLNNNQGTIIELAKRVLENTDWEVDESNSDLLTQYVQEPLYEAVLINDIQVLNLDTNELVTLTAGETIYLFYSFLNNKSTSHVQFIRDDDKPFFIDDDNVIKSTNYRFKEEIKYVIDSETQEVTKIQIDQNDIAEVNGLYYDNQGYRLVYKIQTAYDPVMDRTVDVYQAAYDDGIQEIYHFLDYNYATSSLVIPYITNSSDYQLLDDGTLQGWSNKVVTHANEGAPVLSSIRTTTYPELASQSKLTLTEALSDIRGYMELKFAGVITSNYANTYFNSGFEDNSSIIDHVSAGEKFVLRTRYYSSEEKHGDLIAGAPVSNNDGLRVVVAKYEKIQLECYLNEEAKTKNQLTTITAYKIVPNSILLDFDGAFVLSPNEITNGTFDEAHTQYIVDRVIQVPSTAYIYKTADDDTEYIWHPQLARYIPKNSTESDIQSIYGEEYHMIEFADYYLTTTQARYSLTNEQMTDPKFEMGVFIYTKDNNLVNNYIYLQDIQLTRYYENVDGTVVTLGNVPTAVSNEAHHYYLKPSIERQSKEINTYGSLDFLAAELGIDVNKITPVFNENSEKVLSIQASNSNYFNILQDLCETFECWLDIKVQHNKDGTITLDKDFNPIKRIAFKEYAGKDNFAGFKKGINLSDISRTIDSSEIVTKLIVEPVQSEYTDTGSVDIQYAESNPSKQAHIINLSYYLNRGLITDVERCNKDLTDYYIEVKKYNEEIVRLTQEYVQATAALSKISANRNVYTALIAEAQKKHNEALEKFFKLTKWDYDAFVSKYQNLEAWAVDADDKQKNYLENDTVIETVGEIYTTTATMNNYAGILTNLDKEYEDLSLQCYGAKEYGISIVFMPGDGEELQPSTQVTIDDYISGLEFYLIDDEGGEVIYRTSPNERIFNISNASPYTYIVFNHLPVHYGLKYFKNDEAHQLTESEAQSLRFPIYNVVDGETYNRRFILVPDKDYLEEHKGLEALKEEQIKLKETKEKEFYKKYSRFLEEGTWSSQDYIDSELYYFDALQVSNTSAQPKVSYTINVLEVSQLEGLEGYDFRVGDKTYIEDPEYFGYLYQAVDITAQDIELDENASKRAPLVDENALTEIAPSVVMARTPVREEVIVSEIEWHFDEPENNTVTIQNYKTRFEDLFQRISATVQAVQRNEITYPKTTSILDQSGLINSTLLADSLNGIGGVGFALTTNGSVAATQDGLLIRDLLNPANMMRLASTGLQVSTDGGNNWGTAISAEGISTDVLTAGTINTQKIWLMDGDSPSFRWDKSGLNAYGLDEYGNNSYDLKTYVRFDKYGLYGIKNGEDYVASSLEDVREKAYFGVTWEGFFIKNSYTGGGEVAITSENDIQVLVPGQAVTRGNNLQEKIKIGALEWELNGETTEEPIEGVAPSLYGIRIKNNAGETVMKTGDDGNLEVTGTINALQGNFGGRVTVGNTANNHIIIDGDAYNPTIQSSNYQDGAGLGWLIDGNGDATFSNVSVRGAIKTAVFEYEEIQAVGGAFLFRPSSTIKTARYEPTSVEVIDEDTQEPTEIETYYHYDEETGNLIYNDLIVTVEKPLMFRVGNWVKISNYNTLGTDPAADLTSYGLVHIYEIGNISLPTDEEEEVDENYTNTDGEEEIPETDEGESDVTYEITLIGGCAILDTVILDNLPGGALIDFGNHRTELDKNNNVIDIPGTQNYGIGINSSDNYVNLPARAISLFETTIHPDNDIKVTYNYRGILGTLPRMTEGVKTSVYQYMQGTQGIYTDNMYIGDGDQYLAFYTDDSGDKHLKISAREMIFEYDPETGKEKTWEEKIEEIEAEGVPGPPGPSGQDGQNAINIKIESNIGNNFVFGNREAILSCYVFDGTEDITSTILEDNFSWVKIDKDGNVDDLWRPSKQGTQDGLLKNQISINTDDVDLKSVFYCNVTLV